MNTNLSVVIKMNNMILIGLIFVIIIIILFLLLLSALQEINNVCAKKILKILHVHVLEIQLNVAILKIVYQ
jgi:hypothetical protein